MNETRPGAPLLAVDALQAWYGESHILHGVAFEVLPGEVVTLLGRNGAGKTTTLKSIMGMVEQRSGSVRLDGRELIGLSSDAIARAGIAICPEERGIFASLDVRENHQLVTNGIYRRVRHPMYSAFWLWAVAQALLLPNWIAGFAGLAGFGTLFFGRIAREERMMLETFGDSYRAYMARTGRIFPTIR